MKLDPIFEIAERARDRGRLTNEDEAFVRDAVPEQLASFPRLDLPARLRHPGGFTVSGASVGTFLRSALLIAGQRALGRRYGDTEFYARVEQDLAFGIMRSHFHLGYPKGTHCCVQCTLAVYPVLEANAIRYFDCGELAGAVKEVVELGRWRFAKPAPRALLQWAFGAARNAERPTA